MDPSSDPQKPQPLSEHSGPGTLTDANPLTLTKSRFPKDPPLTNSPKLGLLSSQDSQEKPSLQDVQRQRVSFLSRLSPSPVHVGVDNQSAITTGNAVLHNKIDTHRWPWPLRPNGDTWSLFEEVVNQRGADSTTVSKVKAHQKEEDIARLTQAQKAKAKGNANADYVAKTSILLHGDLLRQYLDMTHHRLIAYRLLMGTVQALIIRTTEATIHNYHSHCKVDPVATAPITRSIQQRKRLLSPLPYATSAQATISLHLDHQLIKQSRWNHHADFLSELYHFWDKVQVATPTEDLPGITWVELLILFEIRTGQRTPSDLTKPRFVYQPLDRGPTVQEVLRNFKIATMNILTQASGNPELKAMLNTNHTTNQRLRMLGTSSCCGERTSTLAWTMRRH